MVMNTGERMSTKNFVFFYKRDATLGSSRFGFVVSKAVGGAVARNQVKRRLREQSRTLLAGLGDHGNFWFVARCLPAAGSVDSKLISDEINQAYATLSTRGAQ
jgi:ribonuclease P protein component